MGIVVELVNRSGQLQSREIIHKDTVSVGRAYDNDVVVNDAFVDPYHFTVGIKTNSSEKDEASDVFDGNSPAYTETHLTLIDNNSVNGVFDKQGHQYPNECLLKKGQTIVIGKTYLRLLTSDCRVPEAQPLTSWENRGDWLASWKVLLSLSIVFSVIAFFEVYLSNPLLDDKTSEYLSIFYMFIVIAIFGGLGALLGKIFHNDSRFILYCSLLLSVLIVSWLMEWILLFAFYSLDMPLIYSWFESITYAFVGAGLILLFLRWCSQLATNTRIFISAIVPLFVLINLSLPLLDKDKVNFLPSYDSTLLPQYLHVGRKYTPQAFVDNTQDLYKPHAVVEGSLLSQ